MDDFLAFCRACGFEIEEDAHCPIDERKPCPVCGSKAREFRVTLQGSLSFKRKRRMKARHASSRKAFLEMDTGDDFYRKAAKWVKKCRIIDRDNNVYYELVKDPKSGDTIHECKEPLSRHRGHGSAKEKEGERKVTGHSN